MKILEVLRTLILENRSRLHRLFTTPDDIKFVATNHQTQDREGHLSYDEIKDIILDAIDSGSRTHTRVGVPNRMLSRLIRVKYSKIVDEFSSNPQDERIKFVHKREDNEDEEVFDFIEFILGREGDDTFLVVSSTFSENGDYLKLHGRDSDSNKKNNIRKVFSY